MSSYQVGLIGAPEPTDIARLTAALTEFVAPFGLRVGHEVVLLDPAACLTRDRKQAFAAVYFGSRNPDDASLNAIDVLIRENVPIIPFVRDLGRFSEEVPAALRFANGMDNTSVGANLERLAAALLECIGLLRQQRRVFVSYRRSDSAAAALQIYEALQEAGFDVFLDTHDVRPAADFQAVLWHRLCDSDVMIMLDTPGYFQSQWTAKELGRALAKKIAVLAIVWPGHSPERTTQLRESIFLRTTDLNGSARLIDPIIGDLKLRVEKIRSRSIALRHAFIAGAVRSAITEIGGAVEAIGSHRSITVTLPNSKRIQVFPAVGVPTAETFFDVSERSAQLSARVGAFPVIAYDHVGLHPRWVSHLAWLSTHVTDLHSIRVTEASWDLVELEWA